MDRRLPMSENHASTPPEGSEARGDSGRLLLVGAKRHIRRLSGCLDQSPLSSLPIVGFVDVTGRGRQLVVHPMSEPVPILGRLDRLADLVRRSRATDLVVALPERRAMRIRPQITGLSHDTVRVHWADESPVARSGGATPHLRSGKRTLSRPPWSLRWSRLAKRALDILGATLGLILLAPLFAVIALLIVRNSGRPIFYTQERIGQGGRIFRIVKFRSMRVDAESETGPIWASEHDERCTRIGDWLRHTNIDELPQLINVLIGDMSLVGPRPERPMFVETFRAELPDYDFRHAVPVGMTGWAQVHGWRGRTSLRKRLQYDLDYIRRWSFWLDLKILLMTVQHVAVGKVQWRSRRARRKLR